MELGAFEIFSYFLSSFLSYLVTFFLLLELVVFVGLFGQIVISF